MGFIFDVVGEAINDALYAACVSFGEGIVAEEEDIVAEAQCADP